MTRYRRSTIRVHGPLAAALLVMTASYGVADPTVKKSGSDAAAPSYELCWADEFDEDGPPSPANWTFETGFRRNNEAQWYQPQNAWCEDGLLVIEARRERRPLSADEQQQQTQPWAKYRKRAEYTSASLHTGGKHEWLYGRFVMRARVPAVAGAWPAFWTVGGGRWPDSGEIDIMEYYDDSVLANVAWRRRNGLIAWDAVKTPIRQLGDASWGDAFHEFRMDWDKHTIELYVDDRLLNRTDLSEVGRDNAAPGNPFHQPQRLLVNLAIGGRHGGDPSPTTFPIRYEIDYVRVYQASVD